MPDEQRVRERAHQLWERDGRPEGGELAFWHEAERQLRAETEGMVPVAPDEGPVDPLRNPESYAPAQDPEYPAITGPVELPAGASLAGQNPAEVVEEARSPGATGEPGSARVPLHERTGRSTLEP
jgi:hypothetical protein